MFKFKGTLVLVVLVVILLAYVLLIEIKKPTGDEKKEQEKIIMKIEDTDKIKSLKFKQKNSEIICEKQNNEWFITSPVKARGDEGMFNGCLANFTELKADEKLTEGLENLSSYGLDNPYCVVTITFEDGTNRVLSIGKKTFNDNSYYARLGEENQIFTIGSYIVDGHFVRSLIDLRDKTVLACSSSDVREFEFKTGERTVKCQKDSKNRWSILSPFNYRADSVQIDTWINTLNSARAKEFIKEESTSTDLAIYGLDKPFMDVTVLSGKDKAKKTLFIGKKATDGYYAKRGEEPQILLIENYSVENLNKDPEEWKDKSVFDVPFGDTVSFEMKKGDTYLAGEKDKDFNWILSKPSQKKATPWKIENQLTSVLSLKSESIVTEKAKDLKEYGLDNPQLTVKITNKEGEEAILLIGKENSGVFYAQRQGQDRIFTVSKNLFDSLSEIITNPPYEEKEKK